MKPILISVITFILLNGVLFAQNEDAALGNKITLTEKTNISDILADPDMFYVGKTQVFEGMLGGFYLRIQDRGTKGDANTGFVHNRRKAGLRG